ncbi:LamG domain-containing protein [Lysinibacillus sp. NPDC093692]|uniref:LamG domain-containing protein n=1 Tax=Lysinibacillus sp. NPDC093692 TaxID=3390578 RepID=UPI003D093F37
MATTEQLMAQHGVAWFDFDEASGNVLDKLGNYYTGTITGATRVSGWNGEGSAMSGNTIASTVVKFNSPIIPNGAKTIRFKLKVTSNKEGVIVTRTQGSAGNGLQIGLYNSYLYINLYEKNNLIFGTGLSKILDINKWYDIMFSWDGTTSTSAVKLYLDEELVSKTTAISNETAVSIHNMSVLGHYSATGFSFDGQLDDLQIYNKALSPSDFIQKRLVVKTTDSKNLVLSPDTARVKEIPNTTEYMMLAQGGIIKEIDSAVDRPPIDFTKTTTEYEIVTNNRTPLGKGRMFTIPIGSDFKTAMIEDNY